MNLESLGLTQQTIIMWLVLGLVAGFLAKYLLPGKDPGGLLTTTLIGIAGAFLGGYLGNYLGVATQVGGLSFLSLITAIAGALVLLVVFRILKILI